jgi:hypothetical protein
VAAAVGRLNFMQNDRERYPLTSDFAKIVSQEALQPPAASIKNGQVADSKAFQEDLVRLKNELTRVMKDTSDVPREIDEAIQQAPKRKENLEQAQQVIERKAYWTSRLDESVPPPKKSQ